MDQICFNHKLLQRPALDTVQRYRIFLVTRKKQDTFFLQIFRLIIYANNLAQVRANVKKKAYLCTPK